MLRLVSMKYEVKFSNPMIYFVINVTISSNVTISDIVIISSNVTIFGNESCTILVQYTTWVIDSKCLQF